MKYDSRFYSRDHRSEIRGMKKRIENLETENSTLQKKVTDLGNGRNSIF